MEQSSFLWARQLLLKRLLWSNLMTVKNEPYIKKRLSLNGHQRWPYECSRQLLTLQGLSEMDKTHHIAYAQINSKF